MKKFNEITSQLITTVFSVIFIMLFFGVIFSFVYLYYGVCQEVAKTFIKAANIFVFVDIFVGVIYKGVNMFAENRKKNKKD